MEIVLALVSLILLVIVAVFYFKQTKNVSELKDTVNSLNQEKNDAIISLEKQISAKNQEVENLKQTLESYKTKTAEYEENIKSLNEKIAEYKETLGREEERNNALEKKLQEIEQQQKENEEILLTKIENITKKMLETGKNELTTTNKQKLEDLLAPLKEKIEDFKKSVEEKQQYESQQFSSLAERIKMLSELSTSLQKEASNLTKALKGEAKTQGNWGEIQVKLLLERAGLQENIHFFEQQTFIATGDNEERKKQIPDFIVKLPDDKAIIIDSKVTLNAVDEWFAAESKESQKAAATKVYISVKKHIDELARKKYEDIQDLNQPDFVLMFLPVEAAFSIAMSEDANLYNYAFDKKVIIVTPTTLLAVLSTIAYMWRQEEQKDRIDKIIKQVNDLYEKFVGFTDDFRKIGNSLNTASKTYNSALNKLSEGRGNLIGRFEKIKDFAKINPKKTIAGIEEITENIKGIENGDSNELE